MTKVKAINSLIATNEFKQLQKIADDVYRNQKSFDLLSVYEDLIDENAWSRLFAYLLDSSKPHGYGQSVFKAFVQAIPALGNLTDLLSANEDVQTICVTEWKTHNNRRVDILIKAVDQKGKLLCVVGIENKVESGEQADQVRDYQLALLKVFPDSPKALIYLTPDGRASKTADVNSGCPAVLASYESISDVCKALLQIESETGHVFLSALKIHIDKLTKKQTMNKEVQELITTLYKNPSHRRAIKLICQYTPVTISIFDTISKNLTNSVSLPFTISKDSVEYYPNQSVSPGELKLYVEDLNITIDNKEFTAAYMLHCETPNPDIDDVFTIRLVLWCNELNPRDKATRRELQEKIRGYFYLPNSIGVDKSWAQWICLWTGGSYKLKDMADRDTQTLTSLLLNAIDLTYLQFREGLKLI